MSRRRKKIQSTIILIITIIVFLRVIGLFVDFGTRVIDDYRLQQIEARVEQEVQLERARHEELLGRKEYVQTDEFVENLARTELNWVKPGDVAVIVVEQTPVASPVTPPPAATATPTAQNWWEELWRDWVVGE